MSISIFSIMNKVVMNFLQNKPLCSNMGEGNGTPLQYSCLENLMDGGAWWAAVHKYIFKVELKTLDTCKFYLDILPI